MVIFENGLILGFIKENINGTTRVYSTLVSASAAQSANELGGGLFQMIRDGVDAKDFRTNAIGRGAYLLVQQTNQVPGAIDGDYLSFGFTGNTRFIAGVRIRGNQVAARTVSDNGQRSEGTGTLEYNFRANGLILVRDAGGNAVAVAVAGQGLYVALSQASFELGLKVPNRDSVTAIQ